MSIINALVVEVSTTTSPEKARTESDGEPGIAWVGEIQNTLFFSLPGVIFDKQLHLPGDLILHCLQRS